MADDRQDPQDDPRAGGREPERRDELDQTREFNPFASAEPPSGGAGRPAGTSGPADHRDRAGDPDRTTESDPSTDPTARHEAERHPPAGLPPSGPADDSSPNPRWSARAGVPPPGHPGRPGPAEWDQEDDRSGRRWWMPILLGVVALLLLGVLSFGIWLIAHSQKGGTPPTAPTTTTGGAPSPTAAPTSAATTGAPTSGPTTEAAPVPVPPLVGLPQDTARAVLDQFGLAYRLRFRVSDQPPGTVIATEPGPGTPVLSGQVVTLVIAEAPSEQPTTAEPTTPSRPRPTR
jgi:hypothetical protein